MNLIDLLQEGTGITKQINDLKWSFGYGSGKDWKIFNIIGSFHIPSLSDKSRKQILHLITIHKEYIIRAMLSKLAGKTEYADIYTSDIKQSIKKMQELGIDWSELAIIQPSVEAELQRRLTEEIVNNDNYGGWIDIREKRVYYVNEYGHMKKARDLGAHGPDLMRWMYDHDYVRFITEYSPSNSLSLQGRLPDIKSSFAMWWPQARKCESVYVDIVTDQGYSTSHMYNVKGNPDDRMRAQKLFGPN